MNYLKGLVQKTNQEQANAHRNEANTHTHIYQDGASEFHWSCCFAGKNDQDC